MKKNTTNKIIKISLNTIFYLIIVGLLVFSIMTIRSKKANSIPNIFGRGYVAVASDSMDATMPEWVEDGKPKPFKKNTLLFIKVLESDDKQKLEVGDIVTFYDDNLEALNTHRIKEVNKQGDQIVSIVTQGDKYQDDDGKVEQVLLSRVYAVHSGKRINGLGVIFIGLQNKYVFAFAIILPVFIILILQAYITFNAFYKLKQEKNKDEIDKRIEEEIERRLKEKEEQNNN